MRNRTVIASNFAFSSRVLRLCEGHNGRDHQQIKGRLEDGCTRSEYARGNNSRAFLEIVRGLGAGLWTQQPGKPNGAAVGDRREQRNVHLVEDASCEDDDGHDPDDDDDRGDDTTKVFATAKKEAKAKEATPGEEEGHLLPKMSSQQIDILLAQL